MHVCYNICGFLDWDPIEKHPGTVVTEEDVRALRAKQLVNGGWHILVEKAMDSTHDVNIPELVVCRYIAGQAKAGKQPSRDQAVCHFLREAYREHLKPSHVLGVDVQDDGPNKELMELALKESDVSDPRMVEAIMTAYMDDVDMKAIVTAQFGPRPKKGSK